MRRPATGRHTRPSGHLRRVEQRAILRQRSKVARDPRVQTEYRQVGIATPCWMLARRWPRPRVPFEEPTSADRAIGDLQRDPRAIGHLVRAKEVYDAPRDFRMLHSSVDLLLLRRLVLPVLMQDQMRDNTLCIPHEGDLRIDLFQEEIHFCLRPQT